MTNLMCVTNVLMKTAAKRASETVKAYYIVVHNNIVITQGDPLLRRKSESNAMVYYTVAYLMGDISMVHDL